ncbi:MAG: hypothetical protein L6R42_000257 [Xanthoria sp. 1 TBL-2021]|nr:MAG: hypothetical protein L6R42_000257 [Xanthoria sp. 1 TBL-2021]
MLKSTRPSDPIEELIKRPLSPELSRETPRPQKRPGGAARIDHAAREVVLKRQQAREEEAKIAAATRGVQDVVRQHYNVVPQRGRGWRRTDSRNKGLRGFNKNNAMGRGGGRGGRDGRGGRGSYGGGRPSTVQDAFGQSIGNIPIVRNVGFDAKSGTRWGGGSFDVVSMMFRMHYAFEDEGKAREMLLNITVAFKKGGKFIRTIPNTDILRIKRPLCSIIPSRPLPLRPPVRGRKSRAWKRLGTEVKAKQESKAEKGKEKERVDVGKEIEKERVNVGKEIQKERLDVGKEIQKERADIRKKQEPGA